jgi:hypothetical protein
MDFVAIYELPNVELIYITDTGKSERISPPPGTTG